MLADRILGGTLKLGGLNDGVLGVYNASDSQIAEISKKGAWFRFDNRRFDSGYGYVTIGQYGYEAAFKNDEPFTIFASEIADDNDIFSISHISSSIHDENYNRVETYGYGVGNTGNNKWSRDFVQLGPNFGSGIWIRRSSKTDYLYNFASIELHGSTYLDGNLTVHGDLAVTGAKPRLVKTKDYGERLLYCYEMAAPVFGDFGSGETDDDGVCYVEIDDVLRETIANMEYKVFLTKEGRGDIWIEEKCCGYFVVKGTPGLRFAWELKAIQRDYEAVRMEHPTAAENNNDEYLEHVYDKDLDKIIKKTEDKLYEIA